MKPVLLCVVAVSGVFLSQAFADVMPPEWVEKRSKETGLAPEKFRRFPSPEDWSLPIGTEMIAETKGAIFSYNLETPVIAELQEDAINPKNGFVVLPQRTRFIGTAMVQKSDDRVNVRFSHIVLPNGTEIICSAIALSSDGSGGISAKGIGVVNRYEKEKVTAATAAGVLRGVSFAMGTGLVTASPLVAGAAGGATDSIAQVTEDSLQAKIPVDVSIFLPPFLKMKILLANRLILDGVGQKK